LALIGACAFRLWRTAGTNTTATPITEGRRCHCRRDGSQCLQGTKWSTRPYGTRMPYGTVYWYRYKTRTHEIEDDGGSVGGCCYRYVCNTVLGWRSRIQLMVHGFLSERILWLTFYFRRDGSSFTRPPYGRVVIKAQHQQGRPIVAVAQTPLWESRRAVQ
jgi:hypothetical protein